MPLNRPHALARLALTIFLLAFACGCRSESASTLPRKADPDVGLAGEPSHGATIYVDEALLRKPYALIGGTVENTGPETLSNLSVVVELKRRAADQWEQREVSVIPDSIAPGEKGRYLLKVLSEEWGDFRIVRLQNSASGREIAFRHMPGAPRPPERVDGIRTIQGEATPRKPRAGSSDDFLNTPDNPVSVP